MRENVQEPDALLTLLIDFFDLPAQTRAEALRQEAVAQWDSLAMVQLISELQSSFGVEFDLDEIEHLRSYEEIRGALERRGIAVEARR
ncbi:MAG TPA: acyl carrier protein [Chthoniobacterales bacterium]